MKKVLIITYYWPPSGGSGVQRWVKFSKYLPSHGWQPVIYTPENPALTAVDATLQADIPPEAVVIRRPIREIYALYHRLSGKKDAVRGEVNPIHARRKSGLQRLALYLRGNAFIPDPRVSWVRPSVRFLRRYLAAHPVDLIVSTGPPHSMHLIARKVAAATGTPWVADFRDPWTKMFYFKHLQLSPWAERKHRRLEREVLDAADAVVAVSPLVQEEFQAMTQTPVHLITNGFDADDFTEPPRADGFFNVTHTGLFAADGNPDRLWEVLGEHCRRDEAFRDRLRIRLAGKTDPEIIAAIRAAGLGANLCDAGYCAHPEAVREQQKASVLLLPLRKEPEYRATLPGKLFEYLAAGAPLLGIGQSDGAMARIVNETGAGTVCDWEDRAAIEAFIDRCWTDWQTAGAGSGAAQAGEEESAPESAFRPAVAAYSRERLTETMAALMEQVAGTARI